MSTSSPYPASLHPCRVEFSDHDVEALRHAAVADSVELSRAGTMAPAVAMATIGLAAGYVREHAVWVWALVGLSLAVGVLRRWQLSRFEVAYAKDPRRYARRLVIGGGATTLLWQAFACGAIYLEGTGWGAMVALAVTVVLSSAGAVAWSSRGDVARGLAVASWLPTVACFGVFAGAPGRITAVLCLVQLVLTLAVIARFERRFWSEQLSSFVVDQRGSELDAARAEAARVGEAKVRFLEIMSHELRTPLSGVMGTVDLLLRREELDSSVVDELRVVERSAQRLERLVRRMLHFAALDRGEARGCSRAFDPVELASGVLDVARERAVERGLELRFDGSNAAASVLADPEHMQTVIEELVTNAIVFSDAGMVEVEMSTSATGDGAGILRLCVADTGEGMAADEIDRAFDRVPAGDAPDASLAQGVGIGMAICRRLIDAAGGRIFVDSRPGKGTTVTVLWPVELQEAAEPPTPLRREVRLPCLVVDDNPVNRRVACKMLARLGFESVEVADGRTAVELASSATYHAIFMDLTMHDMNGLEATRRIRSGAGARAAVPIIALTASAGDGVRQACADAGMNGYVAKPATLDALESALRSVGVVASEIPQRRAG
ncbi:MAG: response regulator [Myxococcales bacterium FL481]|nr:MAG: response regulator [Myxococcales bacterium FL481]